MQHNFHLFLALSLSLLLYGSVVGMKFYEKEVAELNKNSCSIVLISVIKPLAFIEFRLGG